MNFDDQFFKDFHAVIGCDEVGRGPIAGPVNGCAVRVDKSSQNIIPYLQSLNITDSKKLTTKKRLLILDELGIDVTNLEISKHYSISTEQGQFDFILGEKSPQEIDKINILQASLKCMKEASDLLITEHSKIIIDGNKTFESIAKTESVIKGDTKSTIIALASIIAKEYRDHKMCEFDIQYPGYGLASHAGYPTVKHKEAVRLLGPTPIHRKSFRGVKEYV